MNLKEFRFDSLPRTTQVIVFSFFVLCLAFASYWYFLKGLLKERSRLRTEISKLELSVAQGTAIEGRLHQFKQELAQLEQRLAVLQSILPAEKETPAVLRSVQRMAASSNLKINKLTPQAVVPRGFYSDWPIQIEVEGNYDGLGLFFEKVSQATRIIDVGTITIKSIDDPPDASKTLSANCTATTYVFNDEQAEAANTDENAIRKEKRR